MRRRRCDSPWNKLTDEQQKQMDAWYFEQSLSCREIHERAGGQFRIKASRQTLTAYFRHREKKRVLASGGRLSKQEVDELLIQRTGAGMSLEELEARTVYSTALAAYQMSLAEPGSLRVKELRSLMRLLNENRRLAIDQRMRSEKHTFQQAMTALKASREESKIMTKEEFEEMMMDTADIMGRVQGGGKADRKEKENEANSRAAEATGQSQSVSERGSLEPAGGEKEESLA